MRKFLMMTVVAIALALVPIGVGAVNLNPGIDCPGTVGCPDESTLESRIPGIVTAILWIAGVLSVGMIIYAGVRMIISQGDSGKVEQEKKTITYAVVGLIITLLAYAIVAFVADQFGSPGGGGGGEDSGDSTTEGAVG